MGQLLGEETFTVLEFVDNVGRCRRGEPLVWSSVLSSSGANSVSETIDKPSTVAAPSSKATTKLEKLNYANEDQSKRENMLQGRKGGGARAPKKSPTVSKISNNGGGGKGNQDRSSSKSPVPPSSSTAQKQQAKPLQEVQRPGITDSEAPAAKKYDRPTRGKAKTTCGCFGTIHKALTNCLFCGRISCTKEGYDFCPFCGFMVEEVIDDGRYVQIGIFETLCILSS